VKDASTLIFIYFFFYFFLDAQTLFCCRLQVKRHKRRPEIWNHFSQVHINVSESVVAMLKNRLNVLLFEFRPFSYFCSCPNSTDPAEQLLYNMFILFTLTLCIKKLILKIIITIESICDLQFDGLSTAMPPESKYATFCSAQEKR